MIKAFIRLIFWLFLLVPFATVAQWQMVVSVPQNGLLVRIDNTNNNFELALKVDQSIQILQGSVLPRLSDQIVYLESITSRPNTERALLIRPTEVKRDDFKYRVKTWPASQVVYHKKYLQQYNEIYQLWQADNLKSHEKALLLAAEMYSEKLTTTDVSSEYLPDSSILYSALLIARYDLKMASQVVQSSLLALQNKNTMRMLKLHYLASIIFMEQGKYDQAEVHLNWVLNMKDAEFFHTREEFSYIYNEVLALSGLAHLMRGYLSKDSTLMEQGKRLLTQALTNAKVEQDYKLIAINMTMHATYAHLTGQDHNAEKIYLSALQYHQLSGSARELEDTLNNYALLEKSQGKFSTALALHNKALFSLDKHATDSVKAKYYDNVADNYFELGDYRKSYRFYQSSIAIYEHTGEEISRLISRRYLATCLRYQGQYQAALAILSADLNGYKSTLPNLLPAIYAELGLNHLKLENYDKAQIFADQAVSKTTPLLMKKDWFQIKLAQLKIYAKIGHPKILQLITNVEKELMLKEALTKADENHHIKTPLPNIKLDIINLKLLHLTSLSNEQKQELYLDGMKLIDIVSEQVLGRKKALTWLSKTHQFTSNYIDYWISQYYKSGDKAFLEQALRVIDKKSALNLRVKRLNRHLKNSEDKNFQRLNRLLWQTEKQIIRQPNHEQTLKLKFDKIAETKSFYQRSEQINSLELTALPLQKIQQRLQDDELLLVYHLGQTESHLFLVSKKSLEVRKILSPQKISTTLASFNIHNNQSRVRVNQQIELLTQILPLTQKEKTTFKQLTIVTNDILQGVPFSALNIASNSHTYIALGEKFKLRATPSISLYYSGDEQIQHEEKTLVNDSYTKNNLRQYDIAIFADPIFSLNNTEKVIEQRTVREVEKFRQWRESLPRLPWAAAEAISIKNVFKDASVKIVSGDQATNQVLMDDAFRSASILHIATHGYFDKATPDIVGLATSFVNSKDSIIPGFISFTEFMSKPFGANLVVISGCETMQGQQFEGEGFLSLARGVISKGAGAVIGTLWPVADKPTAIFMKYFYIYLKDTKGDISQALRFAQIKMMKSGRYKHPKYWAGFVLTMANHQFNIISI